MSQSPIDDFSAESVARYRQGWKALNRLLHEDRSFSGGERHCAYLNMGSGSFANMSAVSGLNFADDGRAVSSIDWDFDGDLDLWITNRTAPRTRFMLNQGDSKNRSIALGLEGNGTTTNRDAIGARVEVLGLSMPIIQTKYAGESFLSQSSSWLHFGLGKHQGAVDVLVRWPNAPAERFSSLPSQGYHILKQGSGKPKAWTPPANGAAFASNDTTIKKVASSSAASRIVIPGGLPLPTLTEALLNNQQQEIALSAKPTLVNVWASWCQPCLEELTAWSAEASSLQKAGLEVIALNADDNEEGQAMSQAILKRLKAPFRTAIATARTIRRLDILQRSALDLWEAMPVPTSFLIDRHGYVKVIYKGGVPVAQILKDIKLLPLPPSKLRDAATPFPGRWTHDPGVPDPLRVTTQFVDHDLVSEGLAYLQKAIQLDQQHRSALFTPTDFSDRYYVAATILQSQGQPKAALAAFEQASKLNPNDTRIQQGIADLKRQQLPSSKRPKSLSELQAQLKANPGDANIAAEFAIQLVRQGKAKQALPMLTKLVAAKPKDVQLRFYFGVAQQRSGDLKSAIASFEQAHAIDPQDALTSNSLAWIQATHPDATYRNGERAEALAEQLCQRTQFRNPSFLMTLAAAQAERIKFSEAASTIEKAIAIVRAAKPARPADLKVLEKRLALYQSGKHFRDKSL